MVAWREKLRKRPAWELAPLLFLLGCAESAGRAASDVAEAAEASPKRSVDEPRSWFETQKLTIEGSARFGAVVALSDTTAVVGNHDTGIYAYTWKDDTWGEPQELAVGGAAPGWQFGLSAAVSRHTVVIGTPGTVEGPGAHVLSRSASGWTVTQTLALEPLDLPSGRESFGTAVATDGELIAVGAPYCETVFVFARTGDEWSPLTTLRPGDGPCGTSYFGVSVAVSGDVIVVGAPRSGGDPTAAYSGAAYVFTKPSDASQPWPMQKLTADEPSDGDSFGHAVAALGDTVLVGAPAWPGPGAAYAFTKLGSGWSDPRRWTSGGSFESGDYFGYSVALSATRAVVGAPFLQTEDEFLPGGANVFVRDGDAWRLEQALKGGLSNHYFGSSLGIAGDSIIVGEPGASPGSVTAPQVIPRPGSAYVQRFLLDIGNECETSAECGSGHCVSNVCCNEACDAACDECSTGTCLAAAVGSFGSPTCSPFFCDGANRRCPERCLANGDCIEDHFCRDRSCIAKTGLGEACSGPEECLSGHCLAQRCSDTLPNGTPCDDASECERGNCVDGVCCNEVCRGQCEACNEPGDEGRCVAVTGSPRGARERCAGAHRPCKGECGGEVTDVCVYPTTDCDTACENGEETLSKCNQGECVRGEERPCVAFACDDEGKACKVSCESDEHCADGLRCWPDGRLCARSPRCTPDGSSSETPEGLEDCSPYTCGEDQSCKTSCTEPGHCAHPYACDPNQKCVLLDEAAGCGCRTPARTRQSAWPIAALWLICACARRRLSRHAVLGITAR